MSQLQAVPTAGAAQLISELLRAGTPSTYNHKDMTVLLELCGDVLINESVTKDLIKHTIICLKTHVAYICDETVAAWQGLFSRAIVAVKRLTQVDEAAAVEAMELFEGLIFRRLPIIDPHFFTFVKFCQNIIIKQDKDHHGDKLVGKALTLLASVMNWRWRDQIRDLKLIEPVLKTVLPVMCSYNKSETEKETLDELAAQVLTSMAEKLPSELVVSDLLRYVSQALDSPTPLVRRSAFMALTGCCKCYEGLRHGDYLRNKYFDRILFPRVYAGLSDLSTDVCHSALVALGYISKTQQPNISVYLATTLHPVLFTCLTRISEDLSLPYKDIKRAYASLIMICETLQKEILPYLEDLLGFLLKVIESSNDARVKRLAMEAVRSIAEAASTDLGPFLPRIRLSVDRFLKSTTDKAEQEMQSSTFFCLATLAKCLGEQFLPYTTDLLSVGLSVLETERNPNLRASIYQLIGEVSTILREDIKSYLPQIIPAMISSVKLGKGIDKDGPEAELKNACLSLGKISRSVGLCFLPYLRETHKEILPLLKHQNFTVRASSATSLGDLCCAGWSIGKEEGRDVKELEVELYDILHSTVSTFQSMITSDKSRIVVMDVLKSLDVMLKVVGPPVMDHTVVTDTTIGVNTRRHPKMLNALADVICEHTSCQEFGNPEDYTNEMKRERHELLEVFNNIMPSLARTTDSGHFSLFFTYFMGVEIPEFQNPEREEGWANCSDLFFRIKLLTEIVKHIIEDGDEPTYVDLLYEMLLEALAYEEVRVRMDAVYGLGVFVAQGEESTVSKYNDTLERFNTILNTETDSGVIDKVYAAICRMISSNHSAVPMMNYLPALISRLPLQQDCSYRDNNFPVYQCLLALYRSSTLPHIEGLLGKLITVAGQLLDESRVDREMRSLLVEFLSEMERKEKAVVSRVLEEVNLGAQRSIKACLKGCGQEG